VVGIFIFIVAIMNSWLANAEDDLQMASEVIKNKRNIFIEEIMD